MDKVKDLMEVRYKVIADWLFNKLFSVGEILTLEKYKDYGYFYRTIDGTVIYQNYKNHPSFDDYPHLFRQLRWWEEREHSDLPNYIRFGDKDKQHAIYKVNDWDAIKMDGYDPCGYAENPIEYFISLRFPDNYPASLEDYTHYINQKQNK